MHKLRQASTLASQHFARRSAAMMLDAIKLKREASKRGDL
jgi:hypothetical protein